MIHFLRTRDNETLVDSMSYDDDLSISIDIRMFSYLMIAMPIDKRLEFIDDMEFIQDLRGAYFEHPNWDHPRYGNKGGRKTMSPQQFLEAWLKQFGDVWGLWYVED